MITETISTPHQSSRGAHIPQLIVNHIADGTYAGTKAWFQNPESKVSSHFIVARDGRICQCVPLKNMAWCNGTRSEKGTDWWYGYSPLALVQELGGNANQYSVSIEYEGNHAETEGALADAQLDAAVWLHQHIQAEVEKLYSHTIPFDRAHVAGHNEITPRLRPHCPGEKFQWDTLMTRLNEQVQSPALYGVMRQVIALSTRVAAQAYADAMNAQETDGGYWKVIKLPV